MHKLLGFVNGEVVTNIDSLSSRYMLYYSNNDLDYSDIRIVNHANYGEFFDMETGNPIKIEDIKDFIILDKDNKVIFESSKLISNDELTVQYGIVLADLDVTD